MMDPIIFSIFMDNIDPATVEAQAKVMRKFAPNVKFQQIKTAYSHDTTMDMLWALNDVDVIDFHKPKERPFDHDIVIFLDIDCVPVSDKAIPYLIERAERGELVGHVQRSNHIDNGEHLFVAPSCMAIRRDIFQNMGAPAAAPTARSDVAEEYTWAAEANGVPVSFLLPMRHDRPPYRFDWENTTEDTWKLKPGYPDYGVGTTFGIDTEELFWHSFQIFHGNNQVEFIKKCESLL